MAKLAEKLNLNRNYFHMIKATSPDKYNYMMSLDKDIATAYHKYQDEVLSVYYRAQDMYYEMADDKSLTQFSKHLKGIGMYKHDLSFINALSTVVFKSTPGLNHITFVKYKEVINEYDRFKLHKTVSSSDNAA
jgi:hypothetical protein